MAVELATLAEVFPAPEVYPGQEVVFPLARAPVQVPRKPELLEQEPLEQEPLVQEPLVREQEEPPVVARLLPLIR